MPAAKSGGRKFRNDIILVVSLLLAVSLIGIAVFLSGEDGEYVSVTHNGDSWGEFSLAKDEEINIVTGEDGECYNILVIKDGEAYVKEASCPDGICSSHRPISRTGESIVCLPNRIVITVKASQDESDIIS